MSNNTQPPFYEGQRIVRTGRSIINGVQNGKVYTCAHCHQCECGTWYVHVLEFPTHKRICTCTECRSHMEMHVMGFEMGLARFFAPIHPAQADITKELATQPIEERLDVPKINEPILS